MNRSITKKFTDVCNNEESNELTYVLYFSTILFIFSKLLGYIGEFPAYLQTF